MDIRKARGEEKPLAINTVIDKGLGMLGWLTNLKKMLVEKGTPQVSLNKHSNPSKSPKIDSIGRSRII